MISGIAGVTFTGSTDVGVKIAENCGKNLKYQSLEMGGNAPLIVNNDVELDYAVNESMAGRATYLTGQICSVAKRFIVHKDIKDAYVKLLISKLEKIKVGDPMAEDTQMGTLISEKAAKKVEAQVNNAIAQGATLLYGGKRDGAFYGPTVLDNVRPGMDIAHDQEVFGPVFPIMTFETVEEAVAMANDTKYGLGAGIITNDIALGMKVARKLQSGNVVINGPDFLSQPVDALRRCQGKRRRQGRPDRHSAGHDPCEEYRCEEYVQVTRSFSPPKKLFWFTVS